MFSSHIIWLYTVFLANHNCPQIQSQNPKVWVHWNCLIMGKSRSRKQINALIVILLDIIGVGVTRNNYQNHQRKARYEEEKGIVIAEGNMYAYIFHMNDRGWCMFTLKLMYVTITFCGGWMKWIWGRLWNKRFLKLFLLKKKNKECWIKKKSRQGWMKKHSSSFWNVKKTWKRKELEKKQK